ncbi:DUF4238 domain-containing protein [Devosia sp. 1635]|uniref:DUF4238 domain-containing protein n=1 Tax=Devosia sp. 1635 TaxID=2726066 RepID=UPI001564A4E8|nr:DUF4238 domain-containing protein [Devosia sp. 1635]
MAEARNHHYVPQGYLRGFADGIGRKARVQVVDIDTLTSFRTLVRNVAAQRDFNRLDIEGIDPNALEDGYAHLESSAVNAIRRVCQTEKFDGEDRMIILNLMALLVIRNPRMRCNWADVMERLWKMIGEMMVANPARWEQTRKGMKDAGYEVREETTYESMRDFIQGGEYNVVTNRLVHIRLELETLEKVIHLLSARRWRLGVLRDNVPDLITADHPVSLISTIQRPEGLMGGFGYGMMETAVVFPLSRRFSLWGTFEGQDETKDVGWLQAALFNSNGLRNMDRQVYSYDTSFQFIWGKEARRGDRLLQSLKDEAAKEKPQL